MQETVAVTLTGQQADALIAAASATLQQLEGNLNPFAGAAHRTVWEARDVLVQARYADDLR